MRVFMEKMSIFLFKTYNFCIFTPCIKSLVKGIDHIEVFYPEIRKFIY